MKAYLAGVNRNWQCLAGKVELLQPRMVITDLQSLYAQRFEAWNYGSGYLGWNQLNGRISKV